MICWPNNIIPDLIDLNLVRIKELLRRLKNPEKRIPPTIHIAGTNGKGSTISFLRSIFTNAGYKVHQYTSPHILRLNERILISNNQITDSQLSQLINECKSKLQNLHLTFFEFITAIAFLAFSRFPADIVLLETGLGGRYDATNVVKNVILSIITPISFDHTEYLGNTLLKIATEKAGIIKNTGICVISSQKTKILSYLISESKRVGAKNFSLKKDWNFKKAECGFEFINFINKEKIKLPMPYLKGVHQVINAATSIAAIKKLPSQFYITDEHIRNGISNTNWPARMEKIEDKILSDLLPKGSEIWIDGAHNPAAAKMVVRSFSKMPKMFTILINGMIKKKKIKNFLSSFRRQVNLVLAIPISNHIDISEDASKIHFIAKNIGIRSIKCNSLTHAMNICYRNSIRLPVRVIISGSLYLSKNLNDYIQQRLETVQNISL